MSDVDDLRLAHQLADVATRIARRYFGGRLQYHLKSDSTPVTEADLAVERVLLELLQAQRPIDHVLSEEAGGHLMSSGRCWIIDPIDGTEQFLARERDWGTHIALQVKGVLQLAIITRPTEQRRWWAVRGQGAWSSPDSLGDTRSHRLAVSTTQVLSAARIGAFDPPNSPLRAAIAEHANWVVDPVGDIIALAEGRVDAVLDPAGEAWDHAAQALLVIEAGGRYTDRFGGTRIDVHGGTYTNGVLDGQIFATPHLALRSAEAGRRLHPRRS